MGLFDLVKDIVLVPVDITLDVTGITPTKRMFDPNSEYDQPFGTVSRLNSIVNNLEDTMRDD